MVLFGLGFEAEHFSDGLEFHEFVFMKLVLRIIEDLNEVEQCLYHFINNPHLIQKRE